MQAFPSFELVDWEATLAHPIAFPVIDEYLAQNSELSAFYRKISAKTRQWIGQHATAWHAADGLAMAAALDPDAWLESAQCWIGVELEGRHYRGATLVDWQRRGTNRVNARILTRFDRQCFDGWIRRGLAIE